MAPGRARLDPDVKRRRAMGMHENEPTALQAAQAARKQARKADAQALRKKHTVAHALPPSSARKLPASVALHPRTPSLSTSPEPIALALLHDRLQRCPHCYDDGCIGCACMCPDSYEWFKHASGHFFLTCDGCGRECPGCSCMCPNSTVLKEHGGHLATKRRPFD
ncbi:hypothetical protein B0H10DRAFT_1954065 [Mycena sp. CBHHK59/15]|nr:hypothetical protein B0H10DRAFT_1954065 [Mycena sp. CBHHK59/15]